MTVNDALQRLKYGGAVNCVTPSGAQFQIQSKLSSGLAWYRVFPDRKGCLNRYSRLSDGELRQWLESLIVSDATVLLELNYGNYILDSRTEI